MTKLLKFFMRVCVLAIGFQMTTAEAAYTVSSDLASYTSLAGQQSEQFFDGIAPAGGSTFANSMTFGNTTYTAGPAGVTVNLTSASFYPPGSYIHDILLSSFEPTIPGARTLTFTFADSVTAFAFTYGTFNGSPITFTTDDNNSVTYSPAPGFGQLDFIGFTSDVAFNSLSLSVNPASSGTNETWVIGSYFVSAHNVPEPGSFALAGVALLAAGALRRRRH